MHFVEELRWRGLLHDHSEGCLEHLELPKRTGYVGFDPTADSLHIGNLVQIMLLVHFQRAGHRPIVLLGGATGMIGDPSGKSEERKLLEEAQIRHNEQCIKKQLSRFLDFSPGPHAALLLNNYDWLGQMLMLSFLREAGKHISVSYMLSKDSVKSRLATGLSFTEFSYQLLQAYDFYWLNAHHHCTVQMGGADQWGNITTGIELVRRLTGGEVFGCTAPLLTGPDGKKFGKTEKGNIWLDPAKTIPYHFYQFWMNVSDEEAIRYLKIFTTLSQEEILDLQRQHEKQPEQRVMQHRLAKDVTVRVHSFSDFEQVHNASYLVFGRGQAEELSKLQTTDFDLLQQVMPTSIVSKSLIESGVDVVRLLVDESRFIASRTEARRLLHHGAISINKKPVAADQRIGADQLLLHRYMLLQRGKKNYCLLIAQ